MSRVGKNPITIPDGVKVDIKKSTITVEGPKGKLSRTVNPDIGVTLDDGKVVVKRPNDSKHFRALHGLYRSLLANMIKGVADGFEKNLEIVGVGYKGELSNRNLVLQVGFSHPIVFRPPEGIEIQCDGPTKVNIKGVDKELVGQVAAKIRSFRPPEPYKGKGIKYVDEYVRRKAGKTAA